MRSSGKAKNKVLKRSRSSSLYSSKMTVTDETVTNSLDGSNCFPIEEIVHFPLPGYEVPTSVTFNPDGKLITYLYSSNNTLNKNLFLFDPNTGKQELLFSPPDGGLDEDNLSPEEKLRRERLRERGLGVTRYEWVKTGINEKAVMVPLPAGIYFQDLSSQPKLMLPSSPASPIIDPHLSPDGSMLAYVRNNELHVLDLSQNESKQITFGADENTLTHGVAEYIAQEEMDRRHGYWWSLDSKYIAVTRVDSSKIPLFTIVHQGQSCTGPDAHEDHAYPFTGGPNANVRLGVISASGGEVTWMDVFCGGKDQANNDEEYLARVNWMHGNTLTAQVLNRSHSRLKILKFDIQTGEREVLLVEEHDTWVTLHDCFTPLDQALGKFSGGFIWASEKTGFKHIYLHDASGKCLGPITEGDWMVEQIAGVNEAAGLIYFTGTLDSPLECHLYCAKLFPDDHSLLKAPLKLTNGKGKHNIVIDHQMQKYIDIYDSLDSPPRISLCSLHDGSIIVTLYEQPLGVPRNKMLQLQPPEIFQVQAKDGTSLYGVLYKPDVTKFGPPPYKTMVSVYGGPSVQLACDSWINTVDMRAQHLRNEGILVWKMDNRGSARRGLKFEGAIKNNFGRFDAEDQVSGAEWLIKQGLAKVGHIGIYGWSYGGYLSAISLCRFPDVFRCAISGAPVTSWDGYDTFYTEKYMGLPSENQCGYSFGAVMTHVPNLNGKLLLVHGLIDENVHFRHTARLLNALVAARKPYELLIFPDARHMPRPVKDRLYLEERIYDFIERNL